MKSSRVVGLCLAAGQSRRMGCDKLALPFQGSTVGSSVLRTALASGLDHVVVVTREAGVPAWVVQELFVPECRTKWHPVFCMDAALGQAHSVCCGVRAAQEMRADAVLLLLADQPLVTAGLLNQLLSRYQQSLEQGETLDYVAARWQGIPRPPVLFTRRMFPALCQLQGDEGARRLLRQETDSPFLGACVDGEETGEFRDLDTPEEYRLWQ